MNTKKAIEELKSVIAPISHQQLIVIVDSDTEDPDCHSIQTILTHVVHSGFGYVIYIRKSLGEELEFKRKELLDTIGEYQQSLDQMFAYNVKLFEDFPQIKLEEKDPVKKILTNWGQSFDVEQLIEHAIVHILRHRRQIERFLLKM